MIGTVSSLVRAKGFGFILDEDGHDRFFHSRDLHGIFFDDFAQQFEAGVKIQVLFDPTSVVRGDRPKNNGLRAENITVVPA